MHRHWCDQEVGRVQLVQFRVLNLREEVACMVAQERNDLLHRFLSPLGSGLELAWY